MNCKEFDECLDQNFSQRDFRLPEAAEEHARYCTRCRSLLEFVQRGGVGAEAPANLKQAVREAIVNSLEPVQPMPSPGSLTQRYLALTVGLCIVGSVLMGVAGLHLMNLWQMAALGLVALFAIFLTAASLSSLMVPGGRVLVSARTLLIVLPATFVAVLAVAFPWQSLGDFISAGLRCFAGGVMMAAISAIVLYRIVRRGVILSWNLTGAMLGLGSGLIAAVVLQAYCDHQEATHLVVWHGAVILAAIAGGFLIGRRLTG